VSQVLLDKQLTFAKARTIIETKLLQEGSLISEDAEMVIELPCKALDYDNFDLLDAERNH
jgi:hypothetical protein